MKRLLLFLCIAAFAAPTTADPWMGLYEGEFTAIGQPARPAVARVVSEGVGLYRAALEVPGSDNAMPVYLEIHGSVAAPKVLLFGYRGASFWKGEVSGDTAVIWRDAYGGRFEGRRVFRDAPGAGTPPPEGAVVLLPYAAGVAPDLSAWQNTNWEALEDGSMRVKPGTGPNLTREKFGDCRIHLEFNNPHMPHNTGQMRGNSGVYIQNRYEVQVLDSFGVIPGDGDCGAVYTVAAPPVNASLPPGQWQTYDIDFRAPRFDENGNTVEPARVTARHNGVLLHEDLVVPGPTPGGVEGPEVARDVLHLQDHGDPVRYRNIWLVETNRD